LRDAGYRTALSGKMHFCGADQLHGFEERLTTDIYPADYSWTPDWEHPELRPSWYHNMLSVVQAGPGRRSNQLDFDEEVVYAARLLWRDLLRRRPARRAREDARRLRARREHAGAVHRRPRRHAGRARALVQDDLARERGARAAGGGASGRSHTTAGQALGLHHRLAADAGRDRAGRPRGGLRGAGRWPQPAAASLGYRRPRRGAGRVLRRGRRG